MLSEFVGKRLSTINKTKCSLLAVIRRGIAAAQLSTWPDSRPAAAHGKGMNSSSKNNKCRSAVEEIFRAAKWVMCQLQHVVLVNREERFSPGGPSVQIAPAHCMQYASHPDERGLERKQIPSLQASSACRRRSRIRTSWESNCTPAAQIFQGERPSANGSHITHIRMDRFFGSHGIKRRFSYFGKNRLAELSGAETVA